MGNYIQGHDDRKQLEPSSFNGAVPNCRYNVTDRMIAFVHERLKMSLLMHTFMSDHFKTLERISTARNRLLLWFYFDIC